MFEGRSTFAYVPLFFFFGHKDLLTGIPVANYLAVDVQYVVLICDTTCLCSNVLAV